MAANKLIFKDAEKARAAILDSQKKITALYDKWADSVVHCNSAWLASLGFDGSTVNAAFSSVPDDVVRNLLTGQIYDSGWSLSSRIWGDNENTLKDIYQVMAKGLTEK